MTKTDSVNILHELERIEMRWISSGDDEVKICCPAHGEQSPSAALNIKDHVWKCYVPSCGAGGDLVSLLAYALKSDRKTVLTDLQTRYPDIGGISEIPSQTIEKFKANLSKAGPLLKELEERAITPEMMREARIGFHDGRLTIPVFDEFHRCINVRRYLPGAPGPKKMRNTTGHGKPALYRVETITDATKMVVICGGEMKALLTGTLLADKGIAAVSSTGGEGHWDQAWTKKLDGRHVVIMMDTDGPGVAASRKLAMLLYNAAKSIKVLKIPLDQERYPKGDVNDWFGKEDAKVEDLVALIKDTIGWTPPNVVPSPTVDSPAEYLSLEKAFSVGNVGRRIKVDAVIAAADQTPFYVPKDLKVECTRDQPGCIACPVHHLSMDSEGYTDLKIEPSSSALLGLVSTGKKEQQFRLMEGLNIPICKVVKFHVKSHHIVHDCRLSPPIDLTGGRVSDNWYPSLIVCPSSLVDLNVPCAMSGSVYPHPGTQQAIALIDTYEELEDSLSSFSCTPEQLKELDKTFRPGTPGDLAKKLEEVYEDLETNVTWIYERRDMHLALDLAWHSPLMFNFGGRLINGWMNLLVIGDSAQGKSEATSRLLQHYGCGDKVDCKNATVAGLLGGLEQLGNRWFVRWGAIPTRDRALVILEELKGMNTEVMAKLTEMRSSGVAEIPKIERRKAMARTRLIAISNPRSPRPMNSFHFGIQAVHELIGNLEDVRRFDLAIAVAKGEVSDEVINAMPSSRKKVASKLSPDLCRRLILWSWTRKPENIVIDKATTDEIVNVAVALCKEFDEKVPLVDQGTIRHKVARMATALAARTFSTSDGINLVVGAHHVKFVGKFIRRVYNSKALGYGEFSAAERSMSQVREPDVIIKQIRSTKHPRDLCELLLIMDTVTEQDLISACSDLDTGRQVLSLFVRKGALIRTGRSTYAKNAQFIEILREMLSKDKKEEHDTTDDEF